MLAAKGQFYTLRGMPRYRQRQKQLGSGNLIWHVLNNRLYLVFSVELGTFGLLLEGEWWTITTERVSQRCQTKAKKTVKGGIRNNERTLATIYLNMPHTMLLRCACTHRQHRPPHTSAHR